MPQLDSRQAELLLLLLKTQQPISAKNLGSQLGITARMVRYKLMMAQNWLAERGVEMSLRPRTGIVLNAPDHVRKKLIGGLQHEQITALFRGEDRLYLLLFELLSSGQYLSNAALEETLSISRTTLARDLEAAEEWLAERHLYYRRKPRLGLMVVGREDDYRHALIELVLEVCQDMVLMDLFLWCKRPQEIEGIPPGSIKAHFLNCISTWEPESAWRYMSQIEDALEISLVDHDHLSLSLYFCVMIRRFQQGLVVDLPEEKISEQSQLQEFRILRGIFDRYHHETGLQVPDVEIVQLTLETATSLRQSHSDETLPEMFILKQREISPELVEQMVGVVSQRMGCDLQHPDVIERMSQHLRRSLTRLQYGLPISNPLTEQVNKEYPALWKATTEAVEVIEKKLNISFPPEEIAFLTMYMGLSFQLNSKPQGKERRPRVVVACPSGGVTVWMLVSRLRSTIPEVEIVDVLSMRQLNALKQENIDAVISTASFTSRQFPVITVSPFVDNQEVGIIRRRLNL